MGLPLVLRRGGLKNRMSYKLSFLEYVLEGWFERYAAMLVSQPPILTLAHKHTHTHTYTDQRWLSGKPTDATKRR